MSSKCETNSNDKICSVWKVWNFPLYYLPTRKRIIRTWHGTSQLRIRFFPRRRQWVTKRNEALNTAVLRQVVGRNAHAAIPKCNMGYDQYTVRNDWSCRTYFCWSPLVRANICPWPPVPFFQISLKNSALKATPSTFRDCRVHFFRPPFSK